MATLFVVLADSQGSPHSVTLLCLCFGKIVNLVCFQALRIGTEVSAVLSLLVKLSAKSLALVVDFVFVYSFFFQLVSQLEDLYFNVALRLVFKISASGWRGRCLA